ncbi:DUF805 domain-containing protein, partial [Amnibacterium endophyticum]
MSADAPVADEPLRGATAGQAYRRYWQRIVVFSGRASLSEYWWPVLIDVLALVGGSILVAVLLAVGRTGSPVDSVTNALAAVLGVLLVLLSLAMALAGVSVGVRRLHDADLSGWFLLLGLVPSVGGIITIVLSLVPPNPRGARFAARGPEARPAPAPALDAAARPGF